MKSKFVLLFFLMLFQQLVVFGTESSSIIRFNTHWQKVYNVMTQNENVMKMIEMREEGLKKYRKDNPELKERIQDKELYKYNVSVYCLTAMMFAYDELYSDSVVSIPVPGTDKWTSELQRTFGRRVSLRNQEMNKMLVRCAKNEEQEWPVEFFKNTDAQYPEGGEAAKNYLLSKMNIPLYDKDLIIDVSFVVDENGKVTNPIVAQETAKYFSKQDIVAALNQMPNWKPSTLVDGSNVKQKVEWKIGVKKMEFSEGRKKALSVIEDNLICPAGRIFSGSGELQILIDEKGDVINPVKLTSGRREIDCYLDTVPKWHSVYHQEGDTACMILPIRLEKFALKPTFDDAGSLKDSLLRLVKDIPELNVDKVLHFSFVVNSDGEIVNPISVEVDSTVTIERVGKQVVRTMRRKVSGSALTEVAYWLMSLPKWNFPAVTASGVKRSSIVEITLKAENDSVVLMSSNDMNLKESSVGSYLSEEDKTSEIYQVVEAMPEFPGGMAELMKYLQKNIKYPSTAKKNGVQGRVIVQFVVEKDGTITDPVVIRSVDPYLDLEALRIVKEMPRWYPGEQRGKPVRVKFTLPISISPSIGRE